MTANSLFSFALLFALSGPDTTSAQNQPPDPADQPLSEGTSEFIDLTAPPPVPPLLDEARSLVGAQDYPQAIEAFHRYLLTAPEDRQARLELARVYSWTKHFPEAIALYDRLLDEDAGDPAFRLERARVLLWAGHYSEGLGALRGLRAELRQEQEAGQAVPPELLEDLTRTLADGLAWSGDSQAAAREFGTLALEHPQDASLQLSLARALRDGKAIDPALKHYGAYLRLRPDDAAVGLERARVLVWSSRYPEAIQALNALRNQPAARDEADRLLSQALLWSDQIDQALPVLNALVTRHPDDALLALDQARALSRAGRLEEARAAFARYLSLGGNPAEAALGLGQTWQWESDPLRARHAYRLGLLHTPPSPEIVSALHSLEPDLRRTTSVALQLRADVSGFLQQSLSTRTEIPAGLVWVGPQLELDRFSGGSTGTAADTRVSGGSTGTAKDPGISGGSTGTAKDARISGGSTGTAVDGPAWRVGLAAGIRYRYNAHLELRSVLGVQDTALPDGPTVSPKLRLEARWASGAAGDRSRGPDASRNHRSAALQIEGQLDYSDATDSLFTRRALEAGIRQLAGALSATVPPAEGWQAWGQARVAHLFEPSGSANNLMQFQGSIGRTFSASDAPGLEVAATAGALHATRDLTGEPLPLYWSPSYYVTAGLRLGLTASPLDGMTLRARVRGGVASSSEVDGPFPEVSGELTIDHRIDDRWGWRAAAGYGKTVRTDSYWSAQGMIEGWYRF